MANNKVSSLFNVRLTEPKRSNFNLGRVNRFSASPGYVIPCYVEEILPNSYKRLDIEALIQTNATIAPLMGSFKARFDAFFVPTRLYYRHLDLNSLRPNFDDDFPYHYFKMPTTSTVVVNPNLNGPALSGNPTTMSAGNFYTGSWLFTSPDDSTAVANREMTLYVAPSSLMDYLGMFPVGYNAASWKGNKNLNAIPFIGYFDIWRNFYSNPHDKYVPFRSQNLYFEPYAELTQDPSQELYDRYINIECFDRFIDSIVTASYDGESPRSVDVFATFAQTIVSDDYYGGVPSNRFNLSVPLFSGQQMARNYQTRDSFIPLDTRDGIHFGLLPKTYNDDYFNSRFLNSFVTYMEEQAQVTVEDNKFTISQLRLTNRIAKYVDKSVFSDTRFGSWIKAHFGVKTSQKLNIPQFLGSISTNVVFNDIYATAQTGEGDITSNKALGSRASLGQGYMDNKGSFVEFNATEPGYLIVMFSLTPYVSYFQGIKKMYLKDNFYDMYRPEFDAVGYQDLQKLEMFAVGKTYNPFLTEADPSLYEPVDINEFNVSIGKHPAYIEYMTSYDEAHGLFAQKFQYGAWVLNRPYSTNNYDELVYQPVSEESGVNVYYDPNFDATTYIRPEPYNSVFAVDKFTDNFQIQCRFYDRTKQPMSKQILPHL